MFTFTSTNKAIYKYFHRTGDAAKCLFCKKLLLCRGSSSKGLWTHLKSMHNEKYVKFKKKLEAKKANAVKVPPKKVAQTVMGQKRVYEYLETVKSWEELNKLRFKNSCRFIGHFKRRQKNFKSIIIPCGWRITGKQCQFVLKALRLESDTIHVYTFSKHNHPLESDEKRLIHIPPKELMPDANPPPTLRTLDNLEWTFIQTFTNYEQMHQFRHENQCQCRSYDSQWQRVRYSCIRRRSTDLCKFKLMAMRTPTQAYNVYKHGEHNHAASIPKKTMANDETPKKMIFNNFIYRKCRNGANGKIYWVCFHKTTPGVECSAFAITDAEKNVTMTKGHNHAASPTQVEIANLRLRSDHKRITHKKPVDVVLLVDASNTMSLWFMERIKRAQNITKGLAIEFLDSDRRNRIAIAQFDYSHAKILLQMGKWRESSIKSAVNQLKSRGEYTEDESFGGRPEQFTGYTVALITAKNIFKNSLRKDHGNYDRIAILITDGMNDDGFNDDKIIRKELNVRIMVVFVGSDAKLAKKDFFNDPNGLAWAGVNKIVIDPENDIIFDETGTCKTAMDCADGSKCFFPNNAAYGRNRGFCGCLPPGTTFDIKKYSLHDCCITVPLPYYATPEHYYDECY